MTTLVALVLTLLFSSWKEQSIVNEAIFNKRAILKSVEDYIGDTALDDMSDEQVLELFESRFEQTALNMSGEIVESDGIVEAGYKRGKPEDIDMAKEKKKDEDTRIFPFYTFSSDKGKLYILTVRGNGLWDEIWGNIALKEDLNTIAGASFDHKGETPGLGAEIKDNPTFPARFKGKKIYNDAGQYMSINVRKGGAKDPTHDVDGLSGATVTADGVSEMLERCIKYYEPYLNKIKSKTGKQLQKG